MTDRALLLRYGRHDDDCAVCHDSACMPKPACTCGFAAALTPAASLGAVDRLREIEADLNSAAISSGEIGLRGACIDARNKLREIRLAATAPPPAATDHATAMEGVAAWIRANRPTAAPAGECYEAKFATPERLAKPAATVKCDFCGVRPGELHAFDCTALDAAAPTPEHPQSACLECRGKCPTPKLCADARARGAAPMPEGLEPMWPTDPWEALRRIEGMGGPASYVARECLRATQEGGS